MKGFVVSVVLTLASVSSVYAGPCGKNGCQIPAPAQFSAPIQIPVQPQASVSANASIVTSAPAVVAAPIVSAPATVMVPQTQMVPSTVMVPKTVMTPQTVMVPQQVQTQAVLAAPPVSVQAPFVSVGVGVGARKQRDGLFAGFRARLGARKGGNYSYSKAVSISRQGY